MRLLDISFSASTFDVGLSARALALATCLFGGAAFAQDSVGPAQVSASALPQSAAPDASAATPVDPAAQTAARRSYSFFSSEEFRERRSSLPDQNDSLARLSIDAATATSDDRVSATVGLGLWWEIGGQPAAGSYNNFDSIHGSSDFPLWLDVYRLNLEYKPEGPLKLFRLGRQDAEHGRPATFDGGDLELTLGTPRVRFFAFGGRTVHFFQIDPKVLENWIASAGFDVRVSEDLKLEADWRLLRDAVPDSQGLGDLGGPTTVVQRLVTDNTFGLSAQYRHSDWLKARAWVRSIDSALETVGGAVRMESVEKILGLDLKLDIQPATLNELDELDNPFFLTLGPSLPHLKASLDAWKGFEVPAGVFTAHLGGNVRQLINADETAFNRNFVRAYLLGSASRLGGTDFYASVTGEVDGTGFTGHDGTVTAGASAGWSTRSLKLETGTYFQRWRYVYFAQPEELANVRGYYGDVSFTFARGLTVRGRYSYEIFDRILQTFTASLSQAF